jgi:hypothetical protein
MMDRKFSYTLLSYTPNIICPLNLKIVHKRNLFITFANFGYYFLNKIFVSETENWHLIVGFSGNQARPEYL